MQDEVYNHPNGSIYRTSTQASRASQIKDETQDMPKHFNLLVNRDGDINDENESKLADMLKDRYWSPTLLYNKRYLWSGKKNCVERQ